MLTNIHTSKRREQQKKTHDILSFLTQMSHNFIHTNIKLLCEPFKHVKSNCSSKAFHAIHVFKTKPFERKKEKTFKRLKTKHIIAHTLNKNTVTRSILKQTSQASRPSIDVTFTNQPGFFFLSKEREKSANTSCDFTPNLHFGTNMAHKNESSRAKFQLYPTSSQGRNQQITKHTNNQTQNIHGNHTLIKAYRHLTKAHVSKHTHLS